jgi:hypothetical protein
VWLPVTRGGHGSRLQELPSVPLSRAPGLAIKDRFPYASEESDKEHVDTYLAAGSSSDAGVIWGTADPGSGFDSVERAVQPSEIGPSTAVNKG